MNKIPAERLESGISAEVPDWGREAKRPFEWAPGRSLIAAIRSYQRSAGRRGPVAALRRNVAVLRHRFWSCMTGADIPIDCRIGGGLKMPHPNGIVIHPKAVIGPNCLIMQHVTIGTRGKGGLPTIGGHVDISVGASVLGPISIGDHAVVGAHALVLRDMPPGSIALAPMATLRTASETD